MDSLFSVLLSAEPHPDLRPDQRIFEPLIGSWDLDVMWFEDGKQVRRARGEWHFAWVLEGRAVQDVWIVPPRSERASAGDLYEYGTSIRFFDHDSQVWRSTWIGPMRGLVLTFTVYAMEGGIILETKGQNGKRVRWRFSGMSSSKFDWENQVETDKGWDIVQRFAAVRMSAS